MPVGRETKKGRKEKADSHVRVTLATQKAESMDLKKGMDNMLVPEGMPLRKWLPIECQTKGREQENPEDPRKETRWWSQTPVLVLQDFGDAAENKLRGLSWPLCGVDHSTKSARNGDTTG